ncbi:MAG TPA: serine hydrolase, partial [Novosphingobium sp.]|nr:serine hydrolase [Novosphingobium sp.]
MTAPPMSTRRRPFIRSIFTLAPLALLSACGSSDRAPAPLAPAALAAVKDRAGVPREPLARAIDDLFTDPGAGETRALVLEIDGRIVAERYGD